MYFSWVLDTCNWFCFVCIAVERIKRSEEDCLLSLRAFPPATNPASAKECWSRARPHVVDESFPPVRNHHVIHQSCEITIPPEWPWIARMYLNSPISSSQISNLVLKLPRQRQWSQSSSVNSFASWFWNLPFNTGNKTSQCIAPSASRSSWSWCRTICPNSVLFGDLFLSENGLYFPMYWRRIAAAAAAAAAAASRGGRGFPYRGGNGFPMHAWRFNPSFRHYPNLVSFARDSPRQVWKIRNTHYWVVLPSCATRNCNSRCQSCDDEFRSQIFRDHDLSKTIRSVLENSVKVLALQYQEHQYP